MGYKIGVSGGSAYARTTGALDVENRSIVVEIKRCLAAWQQGCDGAWAQVASNIEGETALSLPDFSALLLRFVDGSKAGLSPEDAWVEACRAHQLRGAELAPERRPAVLGRALRLSDYADLMLAVPDHELENKTEAELLVREYAGMRRFPGHKQRLLRQARLGQFLIWATFSPDDGGVDPFLALPHTTAAVRTALGLGHIKALEEPLVLLAYRSDTVPGRVCRPTIADAERHHFYRPHPDPQHPYGLTSPLLPNPQGLAPQPEVVHPAVQGLGLLFPYHVT